MNPDRYFTFRSEIERTLIQTLPQPHCDLLGVAAKVLEQHTGSRQERQHPDHTPLIKRDKLFHGVVPQAQELVDSQLPLYLERCRFHWVAGQCPAPGCQEENSS